MALCTIGCYGYILSMMDMGALLHALCHTQHLYVAGSAAEAPRRGDLDGRGTLSTQALREFCEFFLTTCIDQVDYMSSLLKSDDLLRRMKLHIDDEVQAGSLPKGSFPLLREALLIGEVPILQVRSSRFSSSCRLCAENLIEWKK